MANLGSSVKSGPQVGYRKGIDHLNQYIGLKILYFLLVFREVSLMELASLKFNYEVYSIRKYKFVIPNRQISI